MSQGKFVVRRALQNDAGFQYWNDTVKFWTDGLSEATVFASKKQALTIGLVEGAYVVDVSGKRPVVQLTLPPKGPPLAGAPKLSGQLAFRESDENMVRLWKVCEVLDTYSKDGVARIAFRMGLASLEVLLHKGVLK